MLFKDGVRANFSNCQCVGKKKETKYLNFLNIKKIFSVFGGSMNKNILF